MPLLMPCTLLAGFEEERYKGWENKDTKSCCKIKICIKKAITKENETIEEKLTKKILKTIDEKPTSKIYLGSM